MKKLFSSLILCSLLFVTACVKEKPKATPKKDPFRTLNTNNNTRSAENVVCHNCRATFKLAHAAHKSTHGHNYIECPVCHHDYLKKSK